MMASWHHVIACLINLIVVSEKEITVTVSLEIMVVVYHCNNKTSYFLSMRMKQSDWLIRLSQRAVFLHPARCEMQPARCEMQPARCEIQPNLVIK